MEVGTLATPPMPLDVEDTRRVTHTRLRRRMLYGDWGTDARTRLVLTLGRIREDAVGITDISANAFRSICSESSALYDSTPTIANEDQAAVDPLSQIVRRGGLWPMMQRVMRDTIGMRDMFLAIDAKKRRNNGIEAIYRPVYPDLVNATPDPERPERAIEIREWRLRKRASKKVEWTREVWSIEDAERPYHQVLASDDRTDISEEFGLPPGGLAGDGYRTRYADGAPLLPYGVYHAARTGCLLDPFEGLEVVEGTLQVSVFWSLFGHLLRNASWAQRWLLGAEPVGAGIEGAEGATRSTIVTDASMVLGLKAMRDMVGQAQVGQWSPSADPLAFANAICVYERRLTSFAGLDPSDIQRVSGDPRSGYAIAIGQTGRMKAQLRYSPVFRASDEETLAITAALVNLAAGAPILPDDGWSVEYAPITLAETPTIADPKSPAGTIEAEGADGGGSSG